MALGTALALAKFVPDVIGLFSKKRGKDAEAAINAVESVAELITGKSGDDAVAAISADPELLYKFQIAVMEDSHVKEQMALEDKKDARSAYKVHHEQADKIAERIMAWNLPCLLFLALAQVIVIYLAKQFDLSVEIVAIVSNVLGLLIKSLLDERLSVVGFFFGSSLGSKTKDKDSVGGYSE